MNIILYSNVKKYNYNEFFHKAFLRVSEDRKNKIVGFQKRQSQNLSLASEILLIENLKNFGLDYEQIKIVYNEYNKPFIDEKFFRGDEVYFNKSHSKDYAMCVVSKSLVGCDIQYRKHLINSKLLDDNRKLKRLQNTNLKIAKIYFHSNEYNLLISQKDITLQMNLFYDLWTLKESFLKCIGCGLHEKLNVVDFSENQNEIEIYYKDNKYYLYKINIHDNYSSAVCFENNDEKNIDIRNI